MIFLGFLTIKIFETNVQQHPEQVTSTSRYAIYGLFFMILCLIPFTMRKVYSRWHHANADSEVEIVWEWSHHSINPSAIHQWDNSCTSSLVILFESKFNAWLSHITSWSKARQQQTHQHNLYKHHHHHHHQHRSSWSNSSKTHMYIYTPLNNPLYNVRNNNNHYRHLKISILSHRSWSVLWDNTDIWIVSTIDSPSWFFPWIVWQSHGHIAASQVGYLWCWFALSRLDTQRSNGIGTLSPVQSLKLSRLWLQSDVLPLLCPSLVQIWSA